MKLINLVDLQKRLFCFRILCDFSKGGIWKICNFTGIVGCSEKPHRKVMSWGMFLR